MLTLAKDGVVINHLSYEEDQEKLKRSEINEARDERSNEIAINMLKDNMPIDIIMRYSSLTEKTIEKLKKKCKNYQHQIDSFLNNKT